MVGAPAALAILLVATLSRGSLHPSAPLDPGIGEVERGELLQRVTVAGTVLPVRRSLISPPYSGYIKQIHVKLGQRVEKGDPIISLVQSIRGAEETHPLRAPFGGTVVQVLHPEGEYIEPAKDNSGLVRIDDMSRLMIQSDVPESDIGKIRTGQDVVVKVNSIIDRPFRGVIRDIALAAKDKKDWGRSAVEFEVRMELLDATPNVRPGMSTIVDIITAKREDVLTLPQEFVEKRNEKFWVTLEKGERREVKVGLQNENLFEILGGLKENDRVKRVDFAALPTEE